MAQYTQAEIEAFEREVLEIQTVILPSITNQIKTMRLLQSEYLQRERALRGVLLEHKSQLEKSQEGSAE